MFVGPQVAFMRKVSNYVAKLWRSDEDMNTISLLSQDSFALAILIQVMYVRGNSTPFSFPYVEAHSVNLVFKQRGSHSWAWELGTVTMLPTIVLFLFII